MNDRAGLDCVDCVFIKPIIPHLFIFQLRRESDKKRERVGEGEMGKERWRKREMGRER